MIYASDISGKKVIHIHTYFLGTPSPTKYPCPPGTFTDSTSLWDITQCTDCPQESYCYGGRSAPDGRCPPGHYCPMKTKFHNQYPCPNGTYNDQYGMYKEDQCKDCTLGHFCEKGTVEPIPCPIETYMPYGYNASSSMTVGTTAKYQDDCISCTAGYFCMNATILPAPCGKGKFTKERQSVCQVLNFRIHL